MHIWFTTRWKVFLIYWMSLWMWNMIVWPIRRHKNIPFSKVEKDSAHSNFYITSIKKRQAGGNGKVWILSLDTWTVFRLFSFHALTIQIFSGSGLLWFNFWESFKEGKRRKKKGGDYRGVWRWMKIERILSRYNMLFE